MKCGTIGRFSFEIAVPNLFGKSLEKHQQESSMKNETIRRFSFEIAALNIFGKFLEKHQQESIVKSFLYVPCPK